MTEKLAKLERKELETCEDYKGHGSERSVKAVKPEVLMNFCC